MKAKIKEFFSENVWSAFVVGAITGGITSFFLMRQGADFLSCLAGLGIGCGIAATTIALSLRASK